ncbi:unnamed protein product, partial [Effrenium voratum]
EYPKFTPAVIVDNVSWYPPVKGGGENGKYSTKEVLNSVSWSVNRGQKVGLIGPNGCGKSSLLLMLLQRIKPTGGRILKYPREIQMAYMQQEADLDNTKTAFQELLSVFGDRSIEVIDQDIAACAEAGKVEKMSNHVEERQTAEAHIAEVEQLIAELKLVSYRDSLVRDLSGGWQMRVALGKIILSRPDLILLDEPTNHIDLETVEFMENFLRTQEVAMVIVSHDRYFLNQVCNRIVSISDGYCETYRGNYVSYLRKRDKEFYLQWQRYNLHQDEVNRLKKRMKKLQERFLLDTLAEKKQDLEKLLAEAPPKPEVKVVKNFRFPCSLPKPEDAEEETDDLWEDAETEPVALLEVDNLGVSFGDKVILEHISFQLRKGEKVAIVGPNGCGKSTLVRALVQDLDKSAKVSGDAAVTEAGAAYFPQRLAEAFNDDRGSVKDALYMSC